MRIFSILVAVFFITACSAEDNAVQLSATKPQTQKSGWFESKRVKQYLTLVEESLNTSSLLYSRLSPDVAKHIKRVELPSEAVEVVRCVVDNIEKNDLEKQFDKSMKLSHQFNEYIENTPELTILNLESDAQFNTLQSQMNSAEFDPIVANTTECGVMEMTMKVTKESGIMTAMNYMVESEQ